MKMRKTNLQPDSRGDYRPYIGYRLDGKQHRFNLGKDLQEAERRRDRIQLLYKESVAVRASYGLGASWTEAALHAAKWIEKGHPRVVLPEPSVINEAPGNQYDLGGFDPTWTLENAGAIIWALRIASRHYPSVVWDPPATTAARLAESINISMFENAARTNELMNNVSGPARPIAGTLHQALDRYDNEIDSAISKQDRIAGTRATHHDQVKQLKLKHQNIPLGYLDYDACKKMFEYWAARPVKDGNGSIYAKETCKKRITELRLFFNWLHMTTEFGWRKPNDFETIQKKVSKDRVKKNQVQNALVKEPFTIQELCEINKNCDNFQRLILYLGLNCCFGAAEIGRLEIGEIYLRSENPMAKFWKEQGFVSDMNDSWIVNIRHKNQVAGSWWLFPETVKAIEIWLKERPRTNLDCLIVTSEGTNLYREDSKNAQSGFANNWANLMKKIGQLNNEGGIKIRNLPFGSLRDHFSTWAVYEDKPHLASIALCHGKPFQDDLIESYANRPFPKLFELQREYHCHLKPIFDAVKKNE